MKLIIYTPINFSLDPTILLLFQYSLSVCLDFVRKVIIQFAKDFCLFFTSKYGFKTIYAHSKPFVLLVQKINNDKNSFIFSILLKKQKSRKLYY